MGCINPLFELPAAQDLLELPAEQRAPLRALLLQLRSQADAEAERSWKKRKGPMAAYWRAVATYARHTAHILAQGESARETMQRAIRRAAEKGRPAKDLTAADRSTP